MIDNPKFFPKFTVSVIRSYSFCGIVYLIIPLLSWETPAWPVALWFCQW